jgi:hypothetical protein
MPELAVAVPHELGQEEATRRLKESSSFLKGNFSGQFSDLEEEWDGDMVSFAFKAFGIKVRGSLVSEASEVTMNLTLPLMAMMFKGKIEEEIKQHLGKLLA